MRRANAKWVAAKWVTLQALGNRSALVFPCKMRRLHKPFAIPKPSAGTTAGGKPQPATLARLDFHLLPKSSAHSFHGLIRVPLPPNGVSKNVTPSNSFVVFSSVYPGCV